MNKTTNIFENVLTISTDPQSNGGIASVIIVYQKHIHPFKHISSTRSTSKFKNAFVFFKAIILLITRLIFDKKIKIVHIQGASYNSFHRKYIFFWLSKFVFNKKVIYHIHGAEFHLFYNKANSKLKKKIVKFLTNSDMIICLSEEWEKYFKDTFKLKRIEVLNNVINKPEIHTEKQLNKTDIFYFLFLGTIGKRKGIWDILDVIINHKSEFEGRIKLFVGGNGEIEKMLTIIENEKLTEMVEFIGWVKDTKKNEMLNKCQVYILPSYNEGLPISILEAMSYSMPIISTKVGGIPQVVENNKNGFLIEPGNKEQIYSSIKFFIDNPEKVVEYGNNSSEMVKRFYMESVLIKLKSIYNELINH